MTENSRAFALIAAWLIAAAPAAGNDTGNKNSLHDLVLRNGTIYDGSGLKPYIGDVAIDGERITYVGAHRELAARTVIDVKGQAIAPGFINMLAHPEDSLFGWRTDGRRQRTSGEGARVAWSAARGLPRLRERLAMVPVGRYSGLG